jgi:hypothetical protein
VQLQFPTWDTCGGLSVAIAAGGASRTDLQACSCRSDEIVPAAAPTVAGNSNTILNMEWPSSDEDDEDFDDGSGSDGELAVAGKAGEASTSKRDQRQRPDEDDDNANEGQDEEGDQEDDREDEDEDSGDSDEADDDDYESDELDEGEGRLDAKGLQLLQQEKDSELVTSTVPVQCGMSFPDSLVSHARIDTA